MSRFGKNLKNFHILHPLDVSYLDLDLMSVTDSIPESDRQYLDSNQLLCVRSTAYNELHLIPCIAQAHYVKQPQVETALQVILFSRAPVTSSSRRQIRGGSTGEVEAVNEQNIKLVYTYYIVPRIRFVSFAWVPLLSIQTT